MKFASLPNNNTKEIFNTFSLITTPANEFTAKIHNGGKNSCRMPLILNRQDEEKWLDNNLKEKDIKSMLSAFPENLMDAYAVFNDFRNKKHNDHSIIEMDKEHNLIDFSRN